MPVFGFLVLAVGARRWSQEGWWEGACVELQPLLFAVILSSLQHKSAFVSFVK